MSIERMIKPSSNSIVPSAGYNGMPSSVDAERSVLGALLLNDELMVHVAELLTPDDFFHRPHKIIYDICLELNQRFKRIDLLTLKDELEKRGLIDDIGGVVYLISLQEEIPALGLIEQHAHIIRQKSVLRKLINAATEIANTCFAQQDEQIDIVIDKAEKIIL